MKVKVSVTSGGKSVPLEQVSDGRISGALRAAADNVARQLAAVRCPAHDKPPSDVRIHFDASGAADLKYESCCAKLGDAVGRALG